MKRIMTFVLMALLVLSLSSGVIAADYPNKTITLMVPFSAGGGTDVIARLFAPYLEEELDESIAILNKPGSNAEVGITWLYNQDPDGYSIGFTNLPHFVSNPLMRETQYSIDAYQPLINLVTDPGVIAVKADDDRFPDLESFVKFAEENPGSLTIGNSGIGGDDHIATLMLQDRTGAKFTPVPFTGAAPNRTALLGGHIMAAAINASEAVQFVESGQMRVLGVMSEKRYGDLPDVPTFKESGYNVISGSSRGISLLKGVSDEKLQILADAARKAAKNPEFIEKATKAQQPLDIQVLDNAEKVLERYNSNIKELHKKFQW
ncbi:Tricarboxylate transport protein TctC [Halanaerobium saccharolyticum subsp. saccharolyticum DSM 6643]|uniref:Tricarboxylate transport protein TctC n=1 Tax=Halanaerobium saccharolyticum subsp. saccharolyticum DSM 6643 TaxID=1293054 RepID=M5DZ60_9FIRM|nr:tripartite tricarboxylate transporter substrate binding protein [Halanaerobium saccharolyticum]CCU78931.1 Tricarboxylate transport protein TctC [Halanaerobium saccharolyticum subsp. saccharolyticum DSM 6643]